ncbi:MAG: hypothetical protein NC253_06725, partial [Ruminococcus sp.]|nr:hypothetical protein [Ruminococcus sp.]
MNLFDKISEDKLIEKYLNHRNYLAENDVIYFKAYFRNSLYNKRKYNNGELPAALLQQYFAVLEKVNSQHAIYSDDISALTSGAVFELHTMDDDNDEFACLFKNNISVKNCDDYIEIYVYSENLELFTEKYAVPMDVTAPDEELSQQRIVPDGIINDKRIQA